MEEIMLMRVRLDADVVDEVWIDALELQESPAAAFEVICKRAQQAVGNKVIKRLFYVDEEGDACTLAPPSISDALDLCRSGDKVMELRILLEDSGTPSSSGSGTMETESEGNRDEVHVEHSHLKVMRDVLNEGVTAFTDRNCVYKSIPQQLAGAVLFRARYIVPEDTAFTVKAPAGSAVYLFSEAHRDGGFPALGWQQEDAGRFHWQDVDGRFYSLNLWTKNHSGSDMTIPVTSSLVGGVAVQASCAPASCQAKLPEMQDIYEQVPTFAPQQVHHGIVCDGCNQCPLIGRRFKSRVRADYDLCQTCLEKDGNAQEYEEMPERRAPHMIQFCHATVYCDGCEKHGLEDADRYKCAVCEDFDLCGCCYNARERIHPQHDSWVHQGMRIARPAPEDPEDAPAASTAPDTKSLDPSSLDAKASMAAMAALLQHDDPAVRAAASSALASALSALGTSVGTASEKLEKDSVSDISDGWERLENMDLVSAKVVHASVFANDALARPLDLDMVHHGCQACRLAHLEINHAASTEAKAVVRAVVVNDGTEPWPEASLLKLSEGPSWGFHELPLGAVPPGETVELVLDLSFLPGHAGDHVVSAWSLLGPSGPFGPPMVVEVTRT